MVVECSLEDGGRQSAILVYKENIRGLRYNFGGRIMPEAMPNTASSSVDREDEDVGFGDV